MKKALIAGAASTVLAAMPVVGVFAFTPVGANTPVTDKFLMTVAESCTLTRVTAAGTDANGHTNKTNSTDSNIASSSAAAWTLGADEGINTDTFSATLTAGQTYTDIATSNYSVTCNDPDGFSVTVNASNFTKSGQRHTWNYVNGETLGEGTASAWTLTSNHPGKNLSGDSFIVAKRAASSVENDTPEHSNDTFQIKYSMRVASDQDTGTYEATAAYTLNQLPNA